MPHHDRNTMSSSIDGTTTKPITLIIMISDNDKSLIYLRLVDSMLIRITHGLLLVNRNDNTFDLPLHA